MLNLALLFLTLVACILLVALILTLGLWMRGIGSIAFPGLGVLVATPLLAFALLIAVAMVVALTAYLIRYISLETLLSWISNIS